MIGGGKIWVIIDTVLAPSPEVAVNRLVRREVLRQHAPCTTPSAHIEDGVDYLSQRGGLGAAPRLGLRQERGNNIPFRILDVARISHTGHFSTLCRNF